MTNWQKHKLQYQTAKTRPRISMLGSREQMCINEKIKKDYKGSRLNRQCRAINSHQSHSKCQYFHGYKELTKESNKNNAHNQQLQVLESFVLDLEELSQISHEIGVCPYYYELDICDRSEIVFMPYNYLLDKKVRPNNLHRVLDNCILIFDEAHNIEQVCCDAMSFQFHASMLAQCIAEIQQLLELKMFTDVKEEDLILVKAMLLQLEKEIAQVNIPNMKREVRDVTFKGDFIFELLGRAEIKKENKTEIIDICQEISKTLATPEVEFSSNTLLMNKGSSESFAIEAFASALEVIFHPSFQPQFYKINISVENNNGNKLNIFYLCVSVWCLNAGFALKELKSKCHCLLLTSGTLSPLDSFQSELQINFPIVLQNDHLVDETQVFASIQPHGPSNEHKVLLSSKHENRQNNDYKTELGNSILFLCRKIPDGVLVFFASYVHMKSCLEWWERTKIGGETIMNRIQSVKHVLQEEQGSNKEQMQDMLDCFKRGLTDKSRKITGSILFAVMRGKISEGMDFSDNSCRAVVITGIPFSNHMDSKVQQKITFMDQMHAQYFQSLAANGTNDRPKPLNGKEWYQQQALRAVNQAIGRVIRHKRDFGAVILLDHRFKENLSQISKWIRPFVKMDTFGQMIAKLQLFFKTATKLWDNNGDIAFGNDQKSRLLAKKRETVRQGIQHQSNAKAIVGNGQNSIEHEQWGHFSADNGQQANKKKRTFNEAFDVEILSTGSTTPDNSNTGRKRPKANCNSTLDQYMINRNLMKRNKQDNDPNVVRLLAKSSAQ
ncbi:hypothetical protein RFI_13132, partial [Reticulomyxa filosa]